MNFPLEPRPWLQIKPFIHVIEVPYSFHYNLRCNTLTQKNNAHPAISAGQKMLRGGVGSEVNSSKKRDGSGSEGVW